MIRSLFLNLYRYWNWLGVPVMAVAVTALVFLIMGIVSLARKAHLFRAPLAQIQEVRFSEAGPVVLNIEGPHLSTRFARVEFELREIGGGHVEGRKVLLRGRASGVSTARMEYMKFDIPRPGPYTLLMTGLGPPQERDARHSVVFMKPHLRQTMACIAGIVFAGMIFIASFVFFLFRVLDKGQNRD